MMNRRKCPTHRFGAMYKNMKDSLWQCDKCGGYRVIVFSLDSKEVKIVKRVTPLGLNVLDYEVA